MESVNPQLPALRPDAPSLLRRTSSLISAVQGIQQEASAEYWFELATNSQIISENRLAYAAKSEVLLRHKIARVCQSLEQNRSDNKYFRLREYKYGGGAYSRFEEHLWRDDNDALFSEIVECYELLAKLRDSPALKADSWLEAAKIFDGFPFRHPQRASQCYCKSFTHEGRLTTLIAERQQKNYYNNWSNWPEGWSCERIISLDAAIEQFPKYHETYWLRGERRMNAEEYQSAANDFEAYFHLGGPEIRWRYESQARIYFKLGQHKNFEQALANLIRLGGMLLVMGNELVDPNENDLPF